MLKICMPLAILLMGALMFVAPTARAQTVFTPVFDGLDEPWGIDFLPNGNVLVTEKDGRVLLWKDGAVSPVSGAPTVADRGQGGLLDITVAADFATTRTVFSLTVNRNVEELGPHLLLHSCRAMAHVWKTCVTCLKCHQGHLAGGTLAAAWSRRLMVRCL